METSIMHDLPEFKAADLTAASSMFVMAYTVGMVVGPMSGSASMQVLGPAGLLAVMAVVPLIFIPLALRSRENQPAHT